jgi:Plant PDR ABC transporter associated
MENNILFLILFCPVKWHLQAYDIYKEPHWKWAGVGYLFGFYVLFLLLCMVALRLTNPNTLQVVPTVVDPERRKPPTLRLSVVEQGQKLPPDRESLFTLSMVNFQAPNADKLRTHPRKCLTLRRTPT